MKEHDILLAHGEDLARRAGKAGCAHTKFLSRTKAELLRQAFASRRDVRLSFEGGFEDAERSVAVFTQPDWGSYEAGDMLAAVRLSFRKQDSLSHRDILGAVLALGLEREVLGDIAVSEGEAALVCLSEIAGFIAENLTKAGRVGVEAEIISLEALPQKLQELEEKDVTLASLRLDAVVAAAFAVSRTAAAEHIRTGRVQLRHLECLSASQPVEPGDIFSVRGLGRAILLERGGASRKGRLWVKIGIYR